MVSTHRPTFGRWVSFSLFGAALLLGVGCGQGPAPVGPGGDDDRRNGPDEQAFDEYWCCDPDKIPCECPGLWHCTEVEGGKRCTQDHPFTPDDGSSGSWSCEYGEATIRCTGESEDHPGLAQDDGDDWDCEDDGQYVVCTQQTDESDYPDEGSRSDWECGYAPDGESRLCFDEDEGGGGDGDADEDDDWADDWRGGEGEGEGEGEDHPGADGEICNGEDDDRDGRIDEGRVCGDASEGGRDCPAEGAIRICDAYCGVHQTCGPDGNWGPCTVDEACEGVAECDQHSDCERGMYCDYGFCTPGTFDFAPCESDQDCDGGFGFGEDWTCQVDQGVCIADCYHHNECGDGLVCDLGMCVPDPYVPGQC